MACPQSESSILWVIGGLHENKSLSSVEYCTTPGGSWPVARSLNFARHWHAACVVPNFGLLVAGGVDAWTSVEYLALQSATDAGIEWSAVPWKKTKWHLPKQLGQCVMMVCNGGIFVGGQGSVFVWWRPVDDILSDCIGKWILLENAPGGVGRGSAMVCTKP